MNILLDTHTLLWYADGNEQLSQTAYLAIDNTDNNIFVSITSLYEIVIKMKIGKLNLNKSFHQFYQNIIEANINVLPISENYLFQYLNIPLIA